MSKLVHRSSRAWPLGKRITRAKPSIRRPSSGCKAGGTTATSSWRSLQAPGSSRARVVAAHVRRRAGPARTGGTHALQGAGGRNGVAVGPRGSGSRATPQCRMASPPSFAGQRDRSSRPGAHRGHLLADGPQVKLALLHKCVVRPRLFAQSSCRSCRDDRRASRGDARGGRVRRRGH